MCVLGATLAACSSSGAPSAASTRLTITSPADGTILSAGTVPVSATAAGNPSSVLAWVGDKKLGALSKQGGGWTKAVATSTAFVPGANTLTVKALDSSGVRAKELSRVYVLGAPADLGLSVTDAGAGGDAKVVAIGLTKPAAQVSATVNGHPIKTTLVPEPGTRKVTLGADDGIVAGANTVDVTAVAADGGWQKASVVLQVPQGAPLAGAGRDVTASTDVPVQLDATTSRAGAGGGKVSYHWEVVRTPAGAHPVLAKADTAKPTFTADERGDYVLRVHVSQPGQATTADDVTVSDQPSEVPPVGAHLQTQLASINGVALDGSVVVDKSSGRQATIPPGQQGSILVVWDRQTLEVLTVDVAPPSATSTLWGDLNGDLKNRPLGVLAALSSPSGASPSLNLDPYWVALLETLGVNDAAVPWDWDKNVADGKPFSFVSVIGEGNKPLVWRSNFTPAPGSSASALGANSGQLSAGLSGYLELTNDGNDPYTFIPDTYIPIDTAASSSPTTNAMAVGACGSGAPPHSLCLSLPSPPMTVCPAAPSRPTGGFQVVVFWASTLEVVDNAAFATNTGCGSDGTDGDSAGMAAMAALLAKYPASDGTSDHLIAIQSIGKPRPPSVTLDPAWIQLAGAVSAIGGASSALADLGRTSGYSLLGANSLTLPGSDTPYGMTATGDAPRKNATARLGAILARNHRNDLAPSTKSTGGPIGNGLRPAAYAAPTAWPVPCAAGACPQGSTTAGQQAALNYVTNVTAPGYDWGIDFKISRGRDGHCYQPNNKSVRDAYCDTSISKGEWTQFSSFLCAPQVDGVCQSVAPPTSHRGYTFTTTDWNAVVTQLSQEMAYVAATKAALENVTNLANFLRNGGNTKYDLTKLESNILKEIKLSESENSSATAAVWWLDIIADAAGIGWAVAGGFEKGRVVAAIFGSASEALASAGDLTATFGESGGGAGLSEKVETTAQDAVVDMKNRYSKVPQQIGWLGEIVYTDWGKLNAVANSPLTGGDSPLWTKAEDTLATTTLAWLEPTVVSAAYQPDPLAQWTFTDHNCDALFAPPCSKLKQEHVPYGGDANTFSCQLVEPDVLENYFPWNVPDGAQYLAVPPGSPPVRYVLSNVPPAPDYYYTPGNPTDFYQNTTEQTHPPAASSSVVDALFSPVLDYGDTAHLGLFKPDFYEHTMTLTSGNNVTCSNAKVLFGPGTAAAGAGSHDANVFYLTPDSPWQLVNIYSQNARWNGPGPLPGNPHRASGLATLPNNIYFHQGNKLVNDYWTAADGWQGPATLPGSPDSDGVAAVLPVANSPHVFFLQHGKLVNDYFTGGSWQSPGGLPGSPQGDTPLAAASPGPGDMNLFFLQDGKLVNDWYTPAQGWQGSAPLPGQPDKGSPLAAVSDAPGSMHVFFVQGGRLVNDYFSGGYWQGPGPLVATPDTGSGIGAFARGPGQIDVVSSVKRALVIDSYSASTGWFETPILYPR